MKGDTQEIELIQSKEHTLNKKDQESLEKQKSNKVDKYIQLLSPQLLNEASLDLLAQQLLKKEKIRLTPNQYTSQIEAEVLSNGFSFRIWTLKVHAGNFNFLVHILNQSIPSPFHNFQCKSNNQGAKVFLPSAKNKFAIKCFQFDQKQKSISKLIQALKQFCLLKIASGLGVGPSLSKQTGFDIIIYHNCIEFAIERCLQISQCLKKITESDILKLKHKIAQLHHWKIVHVDIKPGNIMYSPSSEQLVFIDFGFSRILKEEVGLKSKTSYAGTINYCSRQMMTLFALSDQIEQFIDLYYNDAHCLQISLEEILRSRRVCQSFEKQVTDYIQIYLSNSYKPSKMQQSEGYSRDYCGALRLKFSIYSKNVQLLLDPSYSSIIKKYAEELLSFINELPYCRYFVKIIPLIKKIAQKDRNIDKQYSFVNLQSKKERVFLPYCLRQAQQEKNVDFFKKMQINKNEESIMKKIIGQKVVITLKLNQKNKLFNIQEVKKMNKALYYSKFIKIVDITATHSTFDEKIKLSKVLIEVEKAAEKKIQTESQYIELEMSLRYILNHFLSEKEEYFQTVIPTAIINLVIIDALSTDQLIDVFNNLSKVQGSVVNLSLMLFRCNFVIEWIKAKIFSPYEEIIYEKALKEIILKHLKMLRRKDNHHFTYLLEILLYCELNIEKVCRDLCQQFLQTFKNLHYIQEEARQQLILFVLYLKQNSYYRMDVLNQIQSLIEISDYNSVFFRTQRITYLHLKISDFFQSRSQIKLQMFSSLYQIFFFCIQDPKLMQKFIFYFTYQNMSHIKQSPADRINLILEFCEDKRARHSLCLMTHIQELISSPQLSINLQIKEKVKAFFNVQDLIRMPFPANTHFNNMGLFYQKAAFYVFILINIYSRQSQTIATIWQYYENLKQHWSETICAQCKQYCYQYLIQIKFMLLYLDSKFDEAIHFCFQQLQYVNLHQTFLSNKISNIAYLVRATVYLLTKPLKEKESYEKISFEQIKSLNLYYICFASKQRYITYAYLTLYTLQNLRSVNQYLFFHQKMLEFIYFYPSKEFTRIYNSLFVQFVKNHLGLMKFKAEQIVSTAMGRDRVYRNPHMCMFFTIFLQILPDTSKYIKKSKIFICWSANFLSNEARILSLRHLFSYLFCQRNQIACVRERRRKIMKYASYLYFKFSFSLFINKLQLNKLRKKSSALLFRKMMLKKLKKIHQKLTL